MSHVWGAGEVQTVFWWKDLGQSDHLDDLGIDGRYQNRSSRSGMGRHGL